MQSWGLQQHIASPTSSPPDLGAERLEAKTGIVLQKEYVLEEDQLDFSHALEGNRGFQVAKFGIRAEEVEGMADNYFGCCLFVEAVEEFGGDGWMQ